MSRLQQQNLQVGLQHAKRETKGENAMCVRLRGRSSSDQEAPTSGTANKWATTTGTN